MVANKVKNIRESLNMTQLDLSIATKIAQSDLSQIENNKKYPFPKWKNNISKVLIKAVKKEQGTKLTIEDIFPSTG